MRLIYGPSVLRGKALAVFASHTLVLLVTSGVILAQSVSPRYAPPAPGMRPVPVFDESMIPGPPPALPIIENGGQMPESVLFHIQGYDYDVRLSSTGLVGHRWESGETPYIDRTEMTFIGANPGSVIRGADPFPGILNYIKGSDESRWAYGLKVYRSIRYENLYPGITLTVEGRHGRLVQTFEIAAGVDPGVIRMAYTGAKLETTTDGSVNAASKTGIRHVSRPVVYESDGLTRKTLKGGFRSTSTGELTFGVAGRDVDRPLVIEAEIAIALYDDLESPYRLASASKWTPEDFYFTYVTGTSTDFARGGHQLAGGDVVVALQVTSEDLPTTDDAFQPEIAGDQGDAYLIRFGPETGNIAWATYYGSQLQDFLFGLACLEELDSCAVAGATYGEMPGGPQGNANTADTDPWVTIVDLNTGIPQQVFQNTDPLDGGCNSVNPFEEGYVMAGFESDGNTIDGTVTTYTQEENIWTVVGSQSAMDPTSDNTWFDAQRRDNKTFAVGAADRVLDQAVFNSQQMNPHIGIIDGNQLAVIHVENDERSWLEDVALPDRGKACFTEFFDLDAQGQIANRFNVDCFPTEGLPSSFTGRRTAFSGEGFPHDIEGNAAGDLWLVRSTDDIDGASRVANTIIDIPSNVTFDTWGPPPRSVDLSFVPPEFVQVSTVQGGLPSVFNFGSAFQGAEVSPNAPEPFRNLPQSGIAGAVYQANVLGYVGVVNLESSTAFLGLSIPQTSASSSPDLNFTYPLDPDQFAGGFPFPLGRDVTIERSGIDPVTVGSFNVLNYFVSDGENSFPASVEEIPNRGNSLAFINATGEDVNVKSGLTVTFDTWDTDENVEDKGIIVVPQSSQESDGGILIQITELGTGAFEAFRIPEEFASQEVRDQARITTVVVDNAPGSGKSGAQGIRLLVFDLGGESIETQVVTSTGDTDELPVSFKLHQNYPNPFNPTTRIDFELPDASPVRLTVSNAIGQRVWVWSSEQMTAGAHTVSWDGSDMTGRPLPSGLYLYRLEAGDYVETRKMSLVR